MRLSQSFLIAALLGACAPAAVQPPKPNVDPGRVPPPASIPSTTPPEQPVPVAPADAAWAQGWMPLGATGVPAFLRAHPEWDGRGVLIGVLDSGIDAGVPGLQRTPNGSPKLLDLRDFSGEGFVALRPLQPVGDSVCIVHACLGGMSRVRAISASGPWYGGLLAERPLGAMPAADLNGDGDETDSLPVLVTQATDGWVVLVDADGNGSLGGERPIRDYLSGRETFGWAQPGQPSPMIVAVNLTTANGAPALDLFFDNSGHGTHVAGIAAGNDLYGVGGFDGVAPGAQLIGLKIANNAHDGVTVNGSMVRALDYAVRFARARRMPLILNMSFGVGNEVEGTARIDAIVDSLLAANPDVMIAISAGNDGPGLSTVGFPGSADRALTVGATLPYAFLDGAPTDGRPDPVAYFSSRGGELAKPDIITPGVAYSTVPRWDTGEERKGGTSMASPYAAGLLALLRSAAVASGIAPTGLQLKQALMVTARPLPGATYLDQGTGTPDVAAAWTWLHDLRPVPDVRVRVADGNGVSAAWRRLDAPGDMSQAFQVELPAGSPSLRATLRSDSPWLEAPATHEVKAGVSTITLHYRGASLRQPGVYVGVVSGWGPDTLAGPLFRLVNTLIVPAPADTTIGPTTLAAGASDRFFFPVDSGRPFLLRVATGAGPTVLGALHAPHGLPGAEESVLPASPAEPAEFLVDASDATAGFWEADALGSPVAPGAATITLEAAPVRLGLTRDRQGVEFALTNLARAAVDLQVGVALTGGQRGAHIPGMGGKPEALAFTVPTWAREVVVDGAMPREAWSRFTDFAFSLYDDQGRIVAQQPMNYATVRLRTELPESLAGRQLTLRLVPALADTLDTAAWTMDLSVRLYAAEPEALDAAAGDASRELQLAPGARAAVRFTLPASPWPLPDGFFPLGQGVVISDGFRWTREAGLPAPLPPVMR